MKLKKGDKVKILSGKDRGREGQIEKVYHKQNQVLILGVNLYKKHLKKSEKAPQGGVVAVPRPIHVAKLALVCPKCTQTTRVGYRVKNNKKFRVCKQCKEKI